MICKSIARALRGAQHALGSRPAAAAGAPAHATFRQLETAPQELGEPCWGDACWSLNA